MGSFLDDLAELVQDPAIRRLAERRAGSRELAEDALQETFRAVAQTRCRRPATFTETSHANNENLWSDTFL